MNKIFKILFVLSLALVLAGCRHNKKPATEEEVSRAIPQGDLPFVELLPHADRHRLDIGIYGIKAPRMDYQIVYTFMHEGQPVERGFGGRDIKLEGKTELLRNGENAVVFGSESSGKFKYDEGVENGSIEITYRDDKGKATGRAVSDWHLQDAKTVTEFTSPDGKLKYKPSAKLTGMVLTMSNLGLPAPATGTVVAGPYGVFASSTAKISGSLTLTLPSSTPAKLMLYDKTSKTWKDVSSTQSGSALTATTSPGVFIVVSQ